MEVFYEKDLSLALLPACSAAAQRQRAALCFGAVFQKALLLWHGRGRQPHRGGQGGVHSGFCGRAGDLPDDRHRQHRLAGS